MTSIGPDILILLFIAGLLAGALNAVAGGATFFTFPALMLAGLPPLVANATNFVALVPGNMAALPAFRTELKKLGKDLFPPVFIGAVGGLLGAITLVRLGGDIFADVVPYLMAMATFLFAVAPHVRDFAQQRMPRDKNKASWLGLTLLFGLSLYGGYFGAGLGQIILAAMILYGYDDFHEINAIKNSVISAISLLSVAVYGLSGAVSWPHALVMMLGATIGGYMGGMVSKFVPQKALRLGVIVFGVFLTVYYFRIDM